MRLYTFGNYYLSSIQQGIQAAHVIADIFVDPFITTEQGNILREWAQQHKTMVCLNGGNSMDLFELYHEIKGIAQALDLPCGIFREDEVSLNEAITCVGIVIPSHIYDFAAMRDVVMPTGANPSDPPYAWYGLTAIEDALAQVTKRYSLAR